MKRLLVAVLFVVECRIMGYARRERRGGVALARDVIEAKMLININLSFKLCSENVPGTLLAVGNRKVNQFQN